MQEEYCFKEVRKGERSSVLSFAQQNGCNANAKHLRHHLSLSVETAEGELVATALCLEQEPRRATIQIFRKPDAGDDALVNELTDRCLRKVQAEDIASVRIQSPSDDSTSTIWSQANWLDRIEETPPAEDAAGDANTGSVADANPEAGAEIEAGTEPVVEAPQAA